MYQPGTMYNININLELNNEAICIFSQNKYCIYSYTQNVHCSGTENEQKRCPLWIQKFK